MYVFKTASSTSSTARLRPPSVALDKSTVCRVPGHGTASRSAWKDLTFGAATGATGRSEQELHDELQLLRQNHGKSMSKSVTSM